ncbi:hypothetical protein, partial [Roseburia sp. TF10-5]|uniref:hypothetical protein n=1 Tax=Roseburia sp. TF10-5 TaxID=2293144 RepID=UPI000E9B0504
QQKIPYLCGVWRFANAYRVEVKGKEMFYIEAVVKDMDVVEDRTAMETLFSYLDKGIDDMEAGRLHTVDDAFQIIRDRMKNEL